MIDSHKIDYSKLDTLNVSRETFLELDEFKEMILDENKKINLISQHTEELARDRHIIDCAQIVDLIDEVLMNIDNEEVIANVRKKVNDLMGQFPLFVY